MPNFSEDPSAYSPNPEEVASLRVQQQQRVDAVYSEMSGVAQAAKREMDLMTQARTRFAKAALYEQIIEGMLFEGDDPVTLEVEEEFKVFAEERLRILLGIDQEKAKLQSLEDEEINVLKMFAAKLLGRQVSMPSATKPVPTSNQQLRPAQVVRQAPPPTVGTLAAPKRGRGRPPGTGKHQRAAAAAQEAQAQQQPELQTMPANPFRVIPKPESHSQPETITVTTPQGEIKQVAVQKGQVGMIRPGQQAPQTSGRLPRPAPMPSPDEMVGKAQMDGAVAFQAIESKFKNPGD